jgi:hypothetical protein
MGKVTSFFCCLTYNIFTCSSIEGQVGLFQTFVYHEKCWSGHWCTAICLNLC